jgi:SAM-dependent methyltransferase
MTALRRVAYAVPSATMQRHLKSLHRAFLGFASRIRKRTDYTIDVIVDAIFGIRTFVRVPVHPDMMARNVEYDPLPYRSLCSIGRHLPTSRDDNLLDLGCGKGRVLCFFALRRLGKCSGIEISPALADEARINAQRLRGRHSLIEVIEGDAIDADIGGASIIYMFHPFSNVVMEPVLRSVEASLRAQPRALRICYANPVQAGLLDSCAWLTCTDSFVVTWSGWHTCPVKIWSAASERVAA